MGLLNYNNNDNSSESKFWSYFLTSLNVNPKGTDGKQRVLSIIAEKFSYSKLNDKLKVCIKIVLTIITFVPKLILSIYYLIRYHRI